MASTNTGIFCLHCGYNLHGLPANRCPECGEPFDLNDPATYTYRRPQLPEPPFLRRLPWIFAISNAVVSLPVVVFDVAATITSAPPRHGDMAMLLLFLLDFPASMAAFIPAVLLDAFGDTGIVATAMNLCLLLLTGFAWYYYMGRQLRRFILAFRGYRDADMDDMMGDYPWQQAVDRAAASRPKPKRTNQ